MFSLVSIASLAGQLAIAAAISSPFSLQITDPPFYNGTYISCLDGHIGPAINAWLISAAPDPNFYFSPSADDPSVGELLYYLPGYPSVSDPYPIGLYPISPGLGVLATNTAPINFTFAAGGELQVVSSGGFLLACNTTTFFYNVGFAINYFNGTGTPDNTSCFNVTIVEAQG